MEKTKMLPVLLLSIILISCGSEGKKEKMEKQTFENPLLKEWAGPHGGVPAFDKMDLAYLEDAIEKGMALHLGEIDSIAHNKEKPTFENTILAMENRESRSNGRLPITAFGAAIFQIPNSGRYRKNWHRGFPNILQKSPKTKHFSNA